MNVNQLHYGLSYEDKFFKKWLKDNNIFMYSTHNEEKPGLDYDNLQGKIYNKTIADNSKSFLDYLNKLVHECNNTNHRYIGKKKPEVILLQLKKLKQILNHLNLKLVIESESLSTIFLAKNTLIIGLEKHL